MKLAEARYDNAETGCCARLDVARWDRQTLTWDAKPFLKDHVRAFLHVPLGFGAVMRRDHAAIEAAEAWAEDVLVLSDERSAWGSDLYLAVDRPVPGAEMAALSGTFMTRVFEGPYHHAGRWAREMTAWVREQGRDVERLYAWYTTCPGCAKRLGANHVVLFAKVRPMA